VLPYVRHLRIKRSYAQRVLNGFEGFTFWQWRAGPFRTWRPDGTTSEKGQSLTSSRPQLLTPNSLFARVIQSLTLRQI